MKVDNDSFAHKQKPMFLKNSKELLGYLKSLNYEELKSIWKSSDKLTRLNFDRIQKMDLGNNLTPAIVSFEGLQYQYMGAGVMTSDQLDYLEEHLRILSGFYGILRPFDGIVPYRLEMQSKPIDWKYQTLYEFWGEKIASSIFSESDCIINLASVEYSKSITKYLTEKTRFINCVFGELIDGRVIMKATLAKMARGEMVRFMADYKITQVEDIKKFDRLAYLYEESLSDENNFVFIKSKVNKHE